jgi:NAD(P)-dependent dehydrogenase (short-subunit alcohol dehydrogenase family)
VTRPGCGRIINITSVHEHLPRVGAAPSCAAKAGLGALTEVLALELSEHGITVNSVAPGEISTPMTDRGPGPGPSCSDTGEGHEWSENTGRTMAANLHAVALALAERPITA